MKTSNPMKPFPMDLAVTGVVQGQGIIKVAKRKASASDAERIRFEQGNAAELVYEDEAFDLVII